MSALVSDAILLMLLMSAFALVSIAAVAGAVAFLQSVLQIQETSLLHLARVGTIALVLYLTIPAATSELTQLLDRVCHAVQVIGKER